MDKREILDKIFKTALESVEPSFLVKIHLHAIQREYLEGQFKKFFIIGFGKASCEMARAVEESIPADLITDGIVITKYGHSTVQKSGRAEAPEPFNEENNSFKKASELTSFRIFRTYEAGHPVPDENGLKATNEIIGLFKEKQEKALVLCLISGGGSALFASPFDGIALKEKQKITKLLLKYGANITELNSVRKHISRVKGGRFAEIMYPARAVSLIISDVIGDRLDVVASGPTAPDNTTFQDALSVIDKFNLSEKIPETIFDTLHRGEQGLIPETPKEDNPVFKNVENLIIGNNLMALNAAKKCAEKFGLKSEVISTDISGEAREAGQWLARKAMKVRGSGSQGVRKSMCLLSGGETTVTVKGGGRGGRNAELALSFAIAIEGIEGLTLLSAGTDGIDGPTDAAGAIVNGKTVTRAKNLGLDPEEYLNNNDSYTFFKKTDSLFITGPTGTNVMDMQVILIE